MIDQVAIWWIWPRLLRHWRQLARDYGKPFYAFTILRDPIDYAVSLFNFLHVLGGFFGVQQYPRFNGTLENFQNTMLVGDHLFNPQCLYLLTGELFDQTVTQESCQWVQDTLRDTMDWVGDTASLSANTLPYLQQLLVDELKSSNKNPLADKVRTAYGSKKLMESTTQAE
jgi:hypothetical protein